MIDVLLAAVVVAAFTVYSFALARAAHTSGFNKGYEERAEYENRELHRARVELKWYKDRGEEVRRRRQQTLSAAQEESLSSTRSPARIRRVKFREK